MYKIYDIDGFLSIRAENVGSKEKGWVQPPSGHELPARPHLFKIGRPGTGENWAEIAAFAIAAKLGLPCASYFFARKDGKMGVISEQFYPNDGRFIPINLVLSTVIDEYDGTKKYKQRKYKLDTAINLLDRLTRNPPINSSFGNPTHVFIGYLIYDILIGNTDRHHENWGLVLELEKRLVTLAPTFDHASSLGRDLSEEKRAMRLLGKDPRATVDLYAQRARSAFFNPDGSGRTLTMREMLEKLVGAYPVQTHFWAERAVQLESAFFDTIFERIPPDCITENAAPFAKRLLSCNQDLLRKVALGG